MSILPLRRSHQLYWFPFCFADISAEEISACLGGSIGLTFGMSKLHFDASVSASTCAQKGFLKTGTIGGQLSVKASCVTSFGHLGMEIQVGSRRVQRRELSCHPQPWLRPNCGTKATLGPSLQEYRLLLKEQELR